MVQNQEIRSLVRETYNKIAESYQELYSDIDEQDRKRCMTFVQACKGKRVADLGCGTGDGAIFYAKHGCKVIGIDFSEKMLEIAKKRDATIQWINSDICSLLLESGSVAGIVLAYTINHLSDEMISQLKSEIDRVLLPEGMILFTFHVGKEEGVIADPADPKLRIYYHFLTKDYLLKKFDGYKEVEYYQRESVDPSELENDKAVFLVKRGYSN